ncbi:hypothetical protein VTI28DRAFT_9533 [Corynascus sepedonium]
MSAIVTRFRGTAAGTGSAPGSLAAGARASERSWDFECMADDGGTENRRGTRFRRPFTLEWIGAVLVGGRLRRAPVRIAVRISVKAEREVERSGSELVGCYQSRQSTQTGAQGNGQGQGQGRDPGPEGSRQ